MHTRFKITTPARRQLADRIQDSAWAVAWLDRECETNPEVWGMSDQLITNELEAIVRETAIAELAENEKLMRDVLGKQKRKR